MKIKYFAMRVLLTAVICALCVSVLVGCGGKDEDDGRIRIVCSVFPEYDWVRNIVGDSDGVSVSVIVSGSTDIHSYNASLTDLVSLKESDMVVSVGGVSDGWVSDALRTDAEGVEHIRLCELEGISRYEVSAESGEHDHADAEHDHGETDEHLWLSPRNAIIAVEYICERICALDADRADSYRKNTAEYVQKLGELDRRLTALGEKMGEDDVAVFADRFPFVYLFEDYGMDYYAAFEGCNTDAEWDTATTVRLANKLDGIGATHLFVTESSDRKLANSVISTAKNENIQIAVLDSMQSAGDGDGESISFIGIMSGNISVLETVFGK